jgi:probable rRNA maturation factor
MAIMKKHLTISYDFHATVKISEKEKAKLKTWLNMATLVMGELIQKHKLIHMSWPSQTQSFRVSILLCGEAKIKQLNQQYRGKDKVTDVLSFPAFTTLRASRHKNEPATPEVFLGDLVICHQRALKQAKEFDIGYWDEFIHLFMHGMIHLMGYDHEVSLREEKVMMTFEDLALNLFSKRKKKGP